MSTSPWRNGDAKDIFKKLAESICWDKMLVVKIRSQCLDAFPILDWGYNVFWKCCFCSMAAARTYFGFRLMFSHFYFRLWEVKYLAFLETDNFCTDQVSIAIFTIVGSVENDMIRVGDSV